MSTYGLIGLLIAFAGVGVSLVCLALGHLFAKKKADLAETLSWSGHIAAILTTLSLSFCCGLLIFCFMTGDISIQYVLQNRSDASGALGILYKLSGLWGGREGSLLFWAWLISIFNLIIALRNLNKQEKLDSAALFVAQLVLSAFVGVLLFSESNMPFTTLPAMYIGEQGQLVGAAKMWGMNAMLEHWAMAIHPPTLFIGYAGMTVPFAYAVAALIVNDSSQAWVEKCTRITMFSWLFLGIGIGLGAIWAYVVLGWGGYWGWDPVENASLLPWLVGVGLIHSFTVYRKRGAFKRWSILCACISFTFVILGTFITRSGIVQSVHAFEGDMVSLVLFLALIVVSMLIGIVGIIIRWKSFAAEGEGGDDFESFSSKDVAYYITNLVVMLAAILLAYLTISSALPSWMPLGGYTFSAGNYNAIARPLSILFLLLMALCPLLAWGKTQGKQFLKNARVPGLFSLLLFAGLMLYYFMYLQPSYDATIASGGSAAEGLLEQGSTWYYQGLSIAGLLAASLLFFNSLFMLARLVRAYANKHKRNYFVALWGSCRNNASMFGGYLAHLSMAIILLGLIGSSMYTTEKIGYVAYDEEKDVASESFVIKDYKLEYKESEIVQDENKADIFYTVRFDVYKNDAFLGTVAPSVQLDQKTQQQQLHAGVISLPYEDLFVVYRGVDEEGAFSLDVRVNPLILCVWGGFGLLMFGVILSTFGKRGIKTPRKTLQKE